MLLGGLTPSAPKFISLELGKIILFEISLPLNMMKSSRLVTPDTPIQLPYGAKDA